MSNLASRLRDIVTGAAPRGARGRPAPSERYRPDHFVDAVAEALGGLWIDADGERCLVVERRYPRDWWHGAFRIGDYARCAGEHRAGLGLLAGPRLRPMDPALPEPGAPEPALPVFIDIETTGLAGGAGTHAFLVGCGAFEEEAFRIRQFFLVDFDAERALLRALSASTSTAGALVSFNGKSFDLPVIETRYLFHRMAFPFAGVAHVDLLHPARRLWRRRRAAAPDAFAPEWSDASSCSLAALERTLVGVLREDDVPGFEIPGRYFHYIRTGDAEPLLPVFEHNRLDLLSLAALTATTLRMIGRGADAARDAAECLGLGRLFDRAGRVEQATRCYARAGGLLDSVDEADVSTRADALRWFARRKRREGRHEDAAAAWQQILALDPCPSTLAREATRALAVHHEHRTRDLDAARSFARRAVKDEARCGPRAEAAARHRLSRLERKVGVQPKGGLAAALLES